MGPRDAGFDGAGDGGPPSGRPRRVGRESYLKEWRITSRTVCPRQRRSSGSVSASTSTSRFKPRGCLGPTGSPGASRRTDGPRRPRPMPRRSVTERPKAPGPPARRLNRGVPRQSVRPLKLPVSKTNRAGLDPRRFAASATPPFVLSRPPSLETAPVPGRGGGPWKWRSAATAHRRLKGRLPSAVHGARPPPGRAAPPPVTPRSGPEAGDTRGRAARSWGGQAAA